MNANVSALHCELREQIPLRIIDGIDRCNRSRVWTYLLEIFGGCLFRNGDYKRMKAFAMLEEPVDVFVDKWREGVRQNTSESERAMAKLTPPLKPPDNAAPRQCRARICGKRLIG